MKSFMKIFLSTGFISVNVLFNIPASNAQADESFMQAFEACKTITQENKRLKCFESLKLNSNNKVKVKPLKIKKTSPEPNSMKEKEKDFGANALKEIQDKKKARELKSLTSDLIEIQKSKSGKNIFILGNGQVWLQLKGDRTPAFIPKKLSNITITVKKKLFGSHSLRYKGNTIKVKRIK